MQRLDSMKTKKRLNGFETNFSFRPVEADEPASAGREPGRRERNKQQSRERIIQAARELFSERGYDATHLREVAARAGMGLGTLFNYVSDKRDLVFFLFNQEMDALLVEQFAALPPEFSFEAKVLRITEAHYRAFAREPEIARIILSEVLFHAPGVHLERYYVLRERLVDGFTDLAAAAQVEGELTRDMEPAFIARAAYYVFAAAIRWWITQPSPKWRSGQHETERVLHLLMRGLAPEVGSQPGKTVRVRAGNRVAHKPESGA